MEGIKKVQSKAKLYKYVSRTIAFFASFLTRMAADFANKLTHVWEDTVEQTAKKLTPEKI